MDIQMSIPYERIVQDMDIGIETIVAIGFGASVGALVWAVRALRRERALTKRLKELLLQDRHTGLPGRAMLEQRIAELMSEKGAKGSEPFAVVVFFLPTYDALVSTYGRKTVQKILEHLWHELDERADWSISACVRSGAAQVAALVRMEDRDTLKQNVTNLLRHCEFLEFGGTTVHVTIQAGIYGLGLSSATPEKALTHAGLAAQHGAPVQFYSTGIRDTAAFENRIESCMRDGLRRQEFKIYYQPKYDIRTRKCIGAESLVRWDSRDLGFLMPGAFIDTFERTGFQLQLDYYIIGQVYRFQQNRRLAKLPIVPISVNQSRMHVGERAYIEHMQKMIEYFGTSDGIEIELTETAFDFSGKEQKKCAIEVVKALKEMGYSISMDDFGTGYSDFALLSLLPLDVMKIDRSLLLAAESSDRMHVLLKKAIELGHGLGMKVICEGIETVAQEHLLLASGCLFGQGFLYGKPMPEEEFEAFLAAHI